MGPAFKVCCILSLGEAEAAVALGARAIGLVADNMPGGPGLISDDRIADIAAAVSARHGEAVWTTLLTRLTDGEAIADHVAATGVNTVQIVDAHEDGAHEFLRRAHPAVRIIQVIHVKDESALEEAARAAETADLLLLDSGKPNASAPSLGGTGETHDWSLSRRIVASVAKPVFLAGGLNPENVAEAVRTVRPFGVDICSGLRDREDGYRLLPDRLAAFAQVLAADGTLGA